MLFLLAGTVGRSIFQNRLLGIGGISGQELLTLMGSSREAMLWATAALILQAIQTCAVPVFAFLLLDGFLHTPSLRVYALELTALAAVSEIPFNLAMSGHLIDLSGRNPAFGLVICLVVLYLFRQFDRAGARGTVIKLVVIAAALLWAFMLNIDSTVALILVVCVLWLLRDKPLYRNIAGCTAAVVCTLISPFYLASPMGFLPLHFYNETDGGGHRLIRLLAYPMMLLVVGLIALLLF